MMLSSRRFRSVALIVTTAAVGVTAACSSSASSSSSTASTSSTGSSASSSASSGNPASSSGGTATPLTLAASVELTGPAAAIGQTWKDGIELAVAAANGTGGFTVAGQKYKWQLNLQDNQSTPDQAISEYRSFAGAGDKFILGPGLTAAFLPAFNSLGSNQVLVLSPSAAAAEAKPQAGQYLFITNNTGEATTVNAVVKATVKKFSPKTVAILLPQDSAGQLYTQLYSAAFAADGVKVVYKEQFPDTTSDFDSYISGIKADKPDMVVSGYLDTYMQPFISQALGAGLTSPVFVGTFGTDSDALGANATKVKGFSWPVPTRAVDNASDPSVAGYRAAWKAAYGSYPTAADAQSLAYYDPVLALTEAMEKSGTVSDTNAISTALKSVTSWPEQVMKESFSVANTAQYPHQIGVDDNGTVSYIDAP
jgi:branched-chain amino acid transport system substrate-binding protein